MDHQGGLFFNLPGLGRGAGSALPTALLICCGLAVAFATGMSMFSIFLHLKNYRKPLLQRMVIRILIMVPIYGISSLIAIFSLDAAFIIDAIRDIYEAFVIYCFFQLLLAYLGGERSLLILLHGRAPKAPVFPLNIFWHEIDVSDPYTFLFLKRGILQYVQIKPVLAAATVILKAIGVYNEGDFRANSGYLYVSIIYNFSIFLSLYCLAIFWVCVNDDLLPFRPMPKFLCIKGIIFFSFWQAAFISVLVAAKVIKKIGPYTDSEHISLALTDTLICFEMILFAIAHQYAFSHTDYIDHKSTYAARMPMGYAFKDAFGFRDVYEDTKATFAGEGIDYKEYEPAEGFMHQGAGRERRIKAGLRYTQGGKRKYWLPMPAAETEPSSVANRVGNLLKAGDSEEVIAPLMQNQADQVINDDAQDSDSDDEFPSYNPSRNQSRRNGHDGYSLYFGSPNNSDDNLFAQSRRFNYGDYKYPVIDVSAESARRAMWDEEQRILNDTRGAYFSPRFEERRLFFEQRNYGATSTPVRISASRHDSAESGLSQHSKGKRVRRGNDDDTRQLLIDYDDNQVPDVISDGVKLKWTRHGNLPPRGSSNKAENGSRSPVGRPFSGVSRAAGEDIHATSWSGSSSSGSASASPRNRKPSLTKPPSSQLKPPDAVDLIVEDPKAAEDAMARERIRGEPAVRGSGLRKVYRHQYVIEDEEGSEAEVEVEEVRDPEAKVDGQRTRGRDVPEESKIKIRPHRTTTEDEIPRAELVTDVPVVREQSPPPAARFQADKYYDDHDSNPWA